MKLESLKRQSEFVHIRRVGRRVRCRSLTGFFLFRRNQPPVTRIGITISRKVGGAVTRNLCRRRLRDALKPMIATIGRQVDLVVNVQPPAASASYRQLSAEIQILCQRMAEQNKPVMAGTRIRTR